MHLSTHFQIDSAVLARQRSHIHTRVCVLVLSGTILTSYELGSYQSTSTNRRNDDLGSRAERLIRGRERGATAHPDTTSRGRHEWF
jgi:hypothetical protein